MEDRLFLGAIPPVNVGPRESPRLSGVFFRMKMVASTPYICLFLRQVVQDECVGYKGGDVEYIVACTW